MDTSLEPRAGFSETGISPVLLAIVDKMDLVTPTPIQAAAIPVALTRRDIVGIAQTGTGKTFAFALPLISDLLSNPGKALVVVPTRELAIQVEESIRAFTRFLNPPMRTVCLIGGAPMYRQVRDLRDRPRIVIATPGRLQDHLNQGNVNLSDVRTLVLDEADRMLDMGFAPQIKKVVESLPSERHTMLFSATMAPEITSLAAVYMKNPERIEVSAPGANNLQITQEVCYVSQTEKMGLLQTLLAEHSGPVLVFSRTKHGASKLSLQIQSMGHQATEIHANRSLGQRKHALMGFKSGMYRVLVATDVAARGIDVPSIDLVINYDLPDAPEDYVHRIGRTGRAGATGKAISFATPDQLRLVKSIERLTKQVVPVSAHSKLIPNADSSSGSRSSYQSRRPSSSSYSRGGGSSFNSSSPSRSGASSGYSGGYHMKRSRPLSRDSR